MAFWFGDGGEGINNARDAIANITSQCSDHQRYKRHSRRIVDCFCCYCFHLPDGDPSACSNSGSERSQGNFYNCTKQNLVTAPHHNLIHEPIHTAEKKKKERKVQATKARFSSTQVIMAPSLSLSLSLKTLSSNLNT